eukprot:scaffold143_cov260-Pinguiococcus_pyrenoidosus.AAC.14
MEHVVPHVLQPVARQRVCAGALQSALEALVVRERPASHGLSTHCEARALGEHEDEAVRRFLLRHVRLVKGLGVQRRRAALLLLRQLAGEPRLEALHGEPAGPAVLRRRTHVLGRHVRHLQRKVHSQAVVHSGQLHGGREHEVLLRGGVRRREIVGEAHAAGQVASADALAAVAVAGRPGLREHRPLGQVVVVGHDVVQVGVALPAHVGQAHGAHGHVLGFVGLGVDAPAHAGLLVLRQPAQVLIVVREHHFGLHRAGRRQTREYPPQRHPPPCALAHACTAPSTSTSTSAAAPTSAATCASAALLHGREKREQRDRAQMCQRARRHNRFPREKRSGFDRRRCRRNEAGLRGCRAPVAKYGCAARAGKAPAANGGSDDAAAIRGGSCVSWRLVEATRTNPGVRRNSTELTVQHVRRSGETIPSASCLRHTYRFLPLPETLEHALGGSTKWNAKVQGFWYKVQDQAGASLGRVSTGALEHWNTGALVAGSPKISVARASKKRLL